MGLRKIAIIGAGAMAREHIRVAKSIANTEICGIYSRTHEKAKKLADEFNIKKVFENIDELYSQTKAEFVVITVSVTDVAKVILECAKYDWKILAEKPVALNFDESLKLKKQLGAKTKNIAVAFNRRCFSSSQSALAELNKSKSHRIVEICDQQSYSAAKEGGHPSEVVKNWMYANSVHLIDMANFFCRGKVSKITNIQPWYDLNTEFVMSHIQYDSNDQAIYRCYLKQPAPWMITIATEQNRYELRPMEKLFTQRAGERASHETPQSQIDLDYKPGFVLQMDNFLNQQNTVTFEESHRTMQLINQIYAV